MGPGDKAGDNFYDSNCIGRLGCDIVTLVVLIVMIVTLQCIGGLD